MKQLTSSTTLIDHIGQPTIDSTITTCEFTRQGDLTVTGDQLGWVDIYQSTGQGDLQHRLSFKAHTDTHNAFPFEQSPTSIKAIQCIGNLENTCRLLTTNGHNIGLWRIDKRYQPVTIAHESTGLPKINKASVECYRSNRIAQIYNCHLGSIKCMEVSHNEERMLTTNGSQVLLWQLERPQKPVQVAYVPRMEGFQSVQDTMFCRTLSFEENFEVESEIFERKAWNSIQNLSALHFQLQSDSCFGYSSKLATIDCVDLRLTNRPKSCLSLAVPLSNDYLRRTLQQVSDFSFCQDGYSILSRDYLHAYLWDMRKPLKPIVKQTIHSPTISHVCDLYQQSELDYRFKISVHDGKMVTGTYGRYFYELDLFNNENLRYDVIDGTASRPAKISPSNTEEDVEFDCQSKISCVRHSPDGRRVCAIYGNHLTTFS